MPSKPKGFRSTSQGAAPIERNRRKLTTTERGYGWAWQKLRKVVLADEPLCRFCDANGLVVAAQEVDHIDGDSFNNERENLRPLCRPCHLDRTARDQAFGKMMWRPEWLKPSMVPLIIVCGAPGSGKSHYVGMQSGPRDLVMDLDDIANKLSGLSSGHDWDRDRWLRPAVRHRNEMLGDIARRASWPAAWLILSEPVAERRQWWADKVRPAAIVVIETPASTCILQARRDPDRNHRGTEMLISKWWSRYGRRTGDTIVRPSGRGWVESLSPNLPDRRAQ